MLHSLRIQHWEKHCSISKNRHLCIKVSPLWHLQSFKVSSLVLMSSSRVVLISSKIKHHPPRDNFPALGEHWSQHSPFLRMYILLLCATHIHEHLYAICFYVQCTSNCSSVIQMVNICTFHTLAIAWYTDCNDKASYICTNNFLQVYTTCLPDLSGLTGEYCDIHLLVTLCSLSLWKLSTVASVLKWEARTRISWKQIRITIHSYPG